MLSNQCLVLLSLLSFIASTTASSLDLCPLDLNGTVAPSSNYTWAQATEQRIRQFDGASYLRPDIGGALLPWIYTIIVLLVHIPVVIIRVVRWQTVQTWCLAATVFTIAITVQAYASTGFQAEKILTWTPLLLVIDAGSMAQVIFLIVEDFSLLTRLRAIILPSTVQIANHLPPEVVEEVGKVPAEMEAPFVELHTLIGPESPTARSESGAPALPPLFTSKPLYIVLASLAFLVTVLVLQILGIAHANTAAHLPAPLVSWCSPIFQPFGVAILDGNCHLWPIEQIFIKGVGCILIPGTQQAAWLTATVAGTALALALEIIDVVILATVHSGTRWRGIKMRRPWFTMFAGVAVLGLTLVFGVLYSDILPPGISERVWVVTEAVGGVGVYEGRLGTAGLRGAMIGWNDGVFEGWGATYFGSWSA